MAEIMRDIANETKYLNRSTKSLKIGIFHKKSQEWKDKAPPQLETIKINKSRSETKTKCIFPFSINTPLALVNFSLIGKYKMKQPLSYVI